MEIKLSKQKYNFQLPSPDRITRLCVMTLPCFWWAVWISTVPALPHSAPQSTEVLAQDLYALALFTRMFCLLTCSHMFWQSEAAFKWLNSCPNHWELCLKQTYFPRTQCQRRQILAHLHAVLKSPSSLWIKLSNVHVRGTHGKRDTTRKRVGLSVKSLNEQGWTPCY